jgi:hypothetical protein
MSRFTKRLSLATVLCAGLGAGSAFGATITFDADKNANPYKEDGFAVSGSTQIVSGNCDSLSGKPCLALNNNSLSTLTALNGSAFTVTSFWFQLLGNGKEEKEAEEETEKNKKTLKVQEVPRNTLIVESSLGGYLELTELDYPNNNGGQVFDLSSVSDFATMWTDVTSLSFSKKNSGNARIDDIEIDVAAVPVPAAGLLLIGALGALGAARRRRKA